MLGNDIVDLGCPEAAGKAYDAPFVARVFDETERERLLASPDPTTTLWAWFAAKEAVYKAMKKLHPERALSLRNISIDAEPGGTVGWARVAGTTALLRWQWGEGFVHCTAWTGPRPKEPVECFIEPLEAASQDSLLVSRRLRELARQKLASLGWDGCEIRRDVGRERFRPPRVYLQGVIKPEAEISFSHDGRFVALAWSCPQAS